MTITMESVPQKKTARGEAATARSIEVIMRFDVTGGKGAMTTTKLTAILSGIVEASRAAVESNNLQVGGIEGTWAWVYGPWYKGRIS